MDCCNHQCEACHKHKERTPEEMKALINRLNRIEGQVRGIRGMVENSAYCPDILTQVAATSAALNAFTKELLASHIRSCVADDIRAGHDEAIDELVQTLQKLRPDVHMTLDDFFSYSFEPGFGALCSDILGFSDAEMDIQYQTWLDYVRTHVPDTFPGMRDLLQRFHAAGGHICVVSHSVPENILRDYRAHDLPTPERIYGWDSDPERRKPAPWPIYQIERELGLRPEQLVVIDDLKPGKDMADRAGVDFIAAGWTHTVPHIIETMQRICPHYCRTVAELAALLLDETEA